MDVAELKGPASSSRRKLERAVERLPVLPAVVAHLMTLDSQSRNYFDEVLRAVEEEPAFAARILSSANSAASAPRSPITTLSAAIGRIGPKSTVNLILAVAALSVFRPKGGSEIGLWRHSVQVAILARNIAAQLRNLELEPDEVYSCALLHDTGRFVFLQEQPELFHQLAATGSECEPGFLARERAVFGVTHPELAALACHRWRLPESVICVVREHHATEQRLVGTRHAKLVALVELCDFLMEPSTAPGTGGLADLLEPEFAALISNRLPSFIEISPKRLLDLVTLSLAESEILAEELGIK